MALTLARAEEQLALHESKISVLTAQLDKLRRIKFGRSSEKRARQIAALEAELAALEQSSDPTVPRALRQTRTRKPFPESLPREVNRLLPAEKSCPDCGGALSYLGEDTAEQLELIRCAFKVIRTEREKHACTRCDRIVQAPAPSRPIERGITGPGLQARVLAGWVEACCRLMAPLEEALRQYVLRSGKVHADDTPVPVLLPGNKKTKTGRLWVYVRDDRNAGSLQPAAVWFGYSPDRKGCHPQAHLSDFSRVLRADAYAGFNELYKPDREAGTITEAAYWAHA